MKHLIPITLIVLLAGTGLVFALPGPILAQSVDGVGQIESFIRNVIQIIAGLAGLIATGFFVLGGFGYITSSGNPENLEKSKRTLIYAAVGLAITVGAFALSNIVVQLASNAFGG